MTVALERFLAGEISVLCHTLDEMSRFSELFAPDSGERKCVYGAIENEECRDGAEFAVPVYSGELKFGVIEFNPISSPLSEYDDFIFTETIDFSDLVLEKENIFDENIFLQMLGV